MYIYIKIVQSIWAIMCAMKPTYNFRELLKPPRLLLTLKGHMLS